MTFDGQSIPLQVVLACTLVFVTAVDAEDFLGQLAEVGQIIIFET